MNKTFNRLFVLCRAAAVVGAMSFLGTSVPVSAHQQQDQKPPPQDPVPPKKPEPAKPAAKPAPTKVQPEKPAPKAPQPQKPAAQPEHSTAPQPNEAESSKPAAKPAPTQVQPEKPAPKAVQKPAAEPQHSTAPEPKKPVAQPQHSTAPVQPQKPVSPPQRSTAPQPQKPTAQPQRSAALAPAQRLAAPQQQVLIGQQQQRLVLYGAQVTQEQRLASQTSVQLQQQKRTAQFGFQQQYIADVRQQQIDFQNSRTYNYGGDPFFYTPSTLRYDWDGHSYETNEYGATVLRLAVNDGYQEGFGAGRADQQDRWAFSYQNSYGYQDGNYGYGGFYIDRPAYNYYFREGFRRGYEDGYYGRSQYGVYATGKYAVLGAVLTSILDLQSIR
jgi:hypothetical protein